ncbi:methylated-DNA--[protein]-cysteine S-methyltransferase [Ramlibacter sp. PS4R-6]|uniref:methylated-DNA--[protein]-cysteine S-methyltransferase n=1 Tax=Ramlibacter sp. PS4R-6 TaxID=3133438 RepID=UPI00309DED98
MAALGYCVFDTAIGACGIAWGEGAIVTCQLPERDREGTARRMLRRHPDVPQAEPPEWVARVVARVQALLAGAKDDLADVPLDMQGEPDFNRRVYEVARAIAPGRTLTYGEVAQRIGEPGSARAVGQALGHNPFAPIVPCHRVLGAGNTGVGFSATGGVDTKLKMLEIERAQLGAHPGLFD